MLTSRRFLAVLIVTIFICNFSVDRGQASDTMGYDTPNVNIEIGACTWNGQKSRTSVTFTLTNTKVNVYPPTGNYFPLTMSNPIVTVKLDSGTYRYVWYKDYNPGSGTWLTSVEAFFTLPECAPQAPQATATLTKGTCTWSEANGSSTPVTIALDHAKLTLNGVEYSASTTINLSPDNYTYSWVATGGYQGGATNQTLVVSACVPTPVSISSNAGACNWDPESGSRTPISLIISGASGTLQSGSTPIGSYKTNDSPVPLQLPPGNYAFIYTPESGYIGSGTYSFSVGSCNHAASVSHAIGSCSYQNGQSQTSVSFGITGAAVTLSGPNNQSYQPSPVSPLLSLPPGDYSYSWVPLPHYDGVSGSGSFHLNSCIPAEVAYSISSCDWSRKPASRDLTFTISDATVQFSGTEGSFTPILGNITYEGLPAGIYSYTWTANAGYTGAGSGNLEVPACTPGNAAVVINFKECGLTEDNTPAANYEILIENASLILNDDTFDDSGTIQLPLGEYHYQWQGKPGFTGEGSGILDSTVCAPKVEAMVSLQIGSCVYTDSSAFTEILISLNGAEIKIYDSEDMLVGRYSTSESIQLPPGDYLFTWSPLDGFSGSGSGSFAISSCETPDKKPSIVFDQDNIDNATGGVLDISEINTDADLPAGGEGPSFFPSLIPILTILGALGLLTYFAQILLKKPDHYHQVQS